MPVTGSEEAAGSVPAAAEDVEQRLDQVCVEHHVDPRVDDRVEGQEPEKPDHRRHWNEKMNYRNPNSPGLSLK